MADVKFDLSENINSIKIIKGLKSYNWYTQLDALKLLTIENVSKMHSDNLFVIGRNIYQAACGNCTDAINYINNFETKTQSFESVKQKNILDGILFEIFFDSNSNLRKEIKGGLFNEVFDLNKNKRLSISFLFIASALNAAKGKFYALPGTGASLQINIESTRVDEGILIRGIYIGGNNALHPTDDLYLNEDGKPIHNVRMNLSDLQTRFSLQLALPIYLQELIFTIEPSINELILFPDGYAVAPG